MYYQEIKADNHNPVMVIVHERGGCDGVVLEHWHYGVEINYAVKVPVDYWIDGEYRRLEAGKLLVINSGSIHEAEPDLKDVAEEGIMAITVIIPGWLFQDQEIETIYFQIKEDEHLEEMKKTLLELAAVGRKNMPDGYFLKMGIACKLIYLLLTNYKAEQCPEGWPGKTNGNQFETVRKMMKYIWENYREPMSVEMLAAHFAFSREHASRIFKKYTGVTIRQYQEKVRVAWACRQLEKTNDPVTKVAMDSGFSDVRSLICVFRRHFGMAPGQYRKHITNR